jgi:DNA-directed RNA polymerase subunit omega
MEKLIKFSDNIYEITCAASRRAFQMSMVHDPLIDDNDGKVVPCAAAQIFNDEVQFRLEAYST